MTEYNEAIQSYAFFILIIHNRLCIKPYTIGAVRVYVIEQIIRGRVSAYILLNIGSSVNITISMFIGIYFKSVGIFPVKLHFVLIGQTAIGISVR